MSDLPTWIENIKIRGTSEVHSQDLLKAIAIALEALEQVSMYARVVHGSKAKDYGEVANDAVRRIEELGQ